MTTGLKFSFVKPDAPTAGVAVILVADNLKFSKNAQKLDGSVGGAIRRAIEVSDFKGKAMNTLDVLAPGGGKLARVIVVGMGAMDELSENDWARLGGAAIGAAGKGSDPITALVERADGEAVTPVQAATFAMGMKLRSYSFNKYKQKKDGKKNDNPKARTVRVATDRHVAARNAWAGLDAVSDGTHLARDLVNEPANVLGPVEFARTAQQISKLGAKVTVLTEADMKKLKMNALLGVGQGSARPSRLVVMQWNGGKARSKPVVFVGKGVVFDTGGISLKPGAGMEAMKGDMGGAAAVTGVMHALAARKAKVNAVGIIGLVENMPDGKAQRPGDIVTSMSGQTIEILNTDAEGRLVLADALWYAKEKFKPVLMVDLATLTGACMVALGKQHAGLFSNDDKLSQHLLDAGLATGEKVWRLPLGPDYDKMIDSKSADMKNIGGRWGGAITAAQLLQRFVGDVPWAHLDVAGTAMDSGNTEINRSWGSGFGVRLLDRFVADNYEG